MTGSVEDRVDEVLMLCLEAFKRRVQPEWIVPAKSGWVTEDHGFEERDGSPEGLYPAMIVPKQDYDKVMVLLPEEKFIELLALWKEKNPGVVENVRKLVEEGKI